MATMDVPKALDELKDAFPSSSTAHPRAALALKPGGTAFMPVVFCALLR